MAIENHTIERDVSHPVKYDVRELVIDDASEYKRIRLEALKSHPNAFAETHEEFGEKSIEDIRAEVSGLRETGGFAVGAFSPEGTLLGMIGVARSGYKKLQHRGHVWGVYVTPSARRAGIIRSLFDCIIKIARETDDLVQLDIEAVTSNVVALKLYKSVGFEVCGTQPRAIKVGSEYFDEYLLVLKLDKVKR